MKLTKVFKMGHPHCAYTIHDERNTTRQWTTFVVMTVKIATCRFKLPLLHPSIFFTSFHISWFLIIWYHTWMIHRFISYACHINWVLFINLHTTTKKNFLSKFLTLLKLSHLIIDNFTILFIYCKKSAMCHIHIYLM